MKRRDLPFRPILWALLLAGAILAGACDDDDDPPPGPWNVTLSGTVYSPHEGQYVYAVVVNSASSATSTVRSALVSNNTFSIAFSGAMTNGGSYYVDWYADGNLGDPLGSGNNACDATTDHRWRVAVVDANGDGTNDVSNGGTPAAVSTSITVNHPHDATFTDVCASF